MSTIIHRRVAEAQAGTNPNVICRVRSGWVVMGDVQFLRGYSLLLPDPVVPSLNSLSRDARGVYCEDMSLIGDALLAVTDAYRINYGILGNVEPALHAHVFPRYESEPEERRTAPAWFYDWQSAPAFDPERDKPLMAQIQQYLAEAGVCI